LDGFPPARERPASPTTPSPRQRSRRTRKLSPSEVQDAVQRAIGRSE
jgi:hypothetical protein